MSLGQTMISTAFFVLLTLAVLTANRMIIERSKGALQLEAVEGATNLADALITEILTKKFDSQVQYDGSGRSTYPYTDSLGHYGTGSFVKWPWPSIPTKFDAYNNLGPSGSAADYVNPGGAPDVAPFKSIRSSGSSYFDDVDDYKGYTRSASSGSITGYLLTVDVYYVKKSGSIITTPTNQTYFKKIDVTVANTLYLPKPLVFSAIATY